MDKTKEEKLKEDHKADNEKLRYDLLSVDAIEDLVRVLNFGASKYADRNWEKGIKWGRVYSAAQRHLTAFWRGEDMDPETGIPHIAHAMCNCMFLLHYMKHNKEFDDRPLHGKK